MDDENDCRTVYHPSHRRVNPLFRQLDDIAAFLALPI
jgi:hypothetical protein